MWLGLIVTGAVAILSFGIAVAISRGRIDLIHAYHTQHVKEADKEAYVHLFAKGIYVIGFGSLAAAFFIFRAEGDAALLAIFSGIICGLLIIHKAQKNYNGSWF